MVEKKPENQPNRELWSNFYSLFVPYSHLGVGAGGMWKGRGVAELTEIRANVASQQSWSLGLAEIGKKTFSKCFLFAPCEQKTP